MTSIQDNTPAQIESDDMPHTVGDIPLLRMIDDMPVAVMTVDPKTHIISYANEASRQLIRSIEHLLPIKAETLIGTAIDAFHRNLAHLHRILADPSNLPHNAHIRVGTEVLDFKISAITASDGSYLGPMVIWSIVTKETEADQKTRRLAQFDALTNLANRSSFNEALAKRLYDTDSGTALLYIDLDGFKFVNDIKGHRVGDDLLRVVANRLRKACSSPDITIGRLGGDEFAVLVPDDDLDRAKKLSGEIIDIISKPYHIDYQAKAEIGASVGIALAPLHGCDGAALLARADIAMYAAKVAGKGGCKVFSPDMERRILERFRLQTQLSESLQNEDGLFVFYQPIIEPVSGRVTCREALIRWHRPARGWIAPSQFIPMAEQGGIIDRLCMFVLDRACRDALSWSDGSRVAVNVSACQLGKGTIAPMVQSALDRSGLPGNRLEVEVTETAILANENRAVKDLVQLHEMGVRVALDDFGTGYSSLTHLRAFHYDKIKIDGSFVKEALEKSHAAAVVGAVADIGKRLGVTTVAEGVETKAHLDWVLKEGCNEVQGYYFGKPQPSLADAALVAKLQRSSFRGRH